MGAAIVGSVAITILSFGTASLTIIVAASYAATISSTAAAFSAKAQLVSGGVIVADGLLDGSSQQFSEGLMVVLSGYVNLANAFEISKLAEQLGATQSSIDEQEYVNLASEKRTNHILYGDETGGGHMYPGAEGKTSFPESWSGKKIMHEISDIVTDPTLDWTANRVVNGAQRYEIIGIRDGITIKVITDGTDIITAFPLKGK